MQHDAWWCWWTWHKATENYHCLANFWASWVTLRILLYALSLAGEIKTESFKWLLPAQTTNEVSGLRLQWLEDELWSLVINYGFQQAPTEELLLILFDDHHVRTGNPSMSGWTVMVWTLPICDLGDNMTFSHYSHHEKGDNLPSFAFCLSCSCLCVCFDGSWPQSLSCLLQDAFLL